MQKSTKVPSQLSSGPTESSACVSSMEEQLSLSCQRHPSDSPHPGGTVALSCAAAAIHLQLLQHVQNQLPRLSPQHFGQQPLRRPRCRRWEIRPKEAFSQPTGSPSPGPQAPLPHRFHLHRAPPGLRFKNLSISLFPQLKDMGCCLRLYPAPPTGYIFFWSTFQFSFYPFVN